MLQNETIPLIYFPSRPGANSSCLGTFEATFRCSIAGSICRLILREKMLVYALRRDGSMDVDLTYNSVYKLEEVNTRLCNCPVMEFAVIVRIVYYIMTEWVL